MDPITRRAASSNSDALYRIPFSDLTLKGDHSVCFPKPRYRPTSVNLWQATNPKARDFRLDVIGAVYTSTTLKEESPGIYLARVPRPVEGFTAFFVELIFDSGFKNPWKFTTEVSVVPDILPFKWEDAKAKYPLKK